MKVTLAVLMLCISSSLSYKILCIFPAGTTETDYLLSNGVVQALLKAGHKVTWATPYSSATHENLTVIDLSINMALAKAIITKMNIATNLNPYIKSIRAFNRNLSRTAAMVPALRRVLVKQQFDAVVTDWLLPGFEAGYAAIQQVPWILVSPVVFNPNLEALVDEVRSVATIPIPYGMPEAPNEDNPIPMGTYRRWNNWYYHWLTIVLHWIDETMRADHAVLTYEKLFAPLAAERGVPLTPYYEAQYNVSILLVNSHESIASGARSLPPNVVNIAGYHINEKPAPLPKKLQVLLDDSPQGVIYFNMATVMKYLEDYKSPHAISTSALMKLFAKLPYPVLYQYLGQPPCLHHPRNVHMINWLPQSAVLAHKNIKILITNGYWLSVIEAIHAGKPLIAIPVYGDEPAIDRARRAGYALRVDYLGDVVEELEEALREMLGNTSYAEKAQYISKVFHHRPVPPSQLIPFYVKHAIETKGAYHLRSVSLKYSWYERSVLDIMLALLLPIVLILLIGLAVKACVW